MNLNNVVNLDAEYKNGFTFRNVVSALSPRVHELTILPTEQCNFRCTYCYEDFEIGKMSSQIIDGVNKYINNRAKEIDRLTISWFGGEPLAALDVIRVISRNALDACKKNNVNFSAGMTTNAYVLDVDTARELLELGVNSYQITIDGDEEEHNKTRIRADGKGTFSRIWQNLTAISNSDLQISIKIRIHVTPRNHDSLLRLISMLNESGFNNRFGIHFHKVSKLGGAGSENVTELKTDEYLKRIALYESLLFGNRNVSSEFSGISSGKYICYASKPNHLLIRADGRLGKCTVALDMPSNTIGKLLPDGSITVDNHLFQSWMVGFESFDEKVLGCPVPTVARLAKPKLKIEPALKIPIALDA